MRAQQRGRSGDAEQAHRSERSRRSVGADSFELHVVALQRSVGNRVTAAALATPRPLRRRPRVDLGAADLQLRSEHPRPDPGRDEVMSTEHHIIPHNALIEFAKVVAKKSPKKVGGGQVKLLASAMPEWSSVDVAELERTKTLTDKHDWATTGLHELRAEKALNVARAVPTKLGELMPKPDAGPVRVAHEIQEISYHVRRGNLDEAVAGVTWQDLGLAGKSVETVHRMFTLQQRGGNLAHHLGFAKQGFLSAQTDQPGAEADAATAYYEWHAGNLFTGPEGKERSDDPGEGFDEEAFWFIGQDHFYALQESYELIKKALKDPTNKNVKPARKKLEATFKRYTAPHRADVTRRMWKQRKGKKWANKYRFRDPDGNSLAPTSI